MSRFATIILAFALSSAATYAALAASDHQRSSFAASQAQNATGMPVRDAGGDGSSTSLPPLADGSVPSDGRMEPRGTPSGVP